MTLTLGSRRKLKALGSFVGRFSEQRDFQATLNRLNELQSRGINLSTEDLDYAQIFLITAEGGMGKTTLLMRLKELVDKTISNIKPHSLLFDFDTVESISDLKQFMDMLHDKFYESKFKKEFTAYQEAVTKQNETQQKANTLEKEYANFLANLAGETIEKSSLGWVDSSTASNFVHIGAKGISDLRGYIKKHLSDDEWELYDNPYKLSNIFMECLNKIASPKEPLFIFLDTFEHVHHLETLFQKQLLLGSGPHVVWVIAGRINKDSIIKYTDKFEEAVKVFVLDTFSQRELEEYLEHQQMVIPDEHFVDNLQKLCRGVPLALEGWVNLWKKTKELPDVDPTQLTTQQEIIRLLTDRFLRYCTNEIINGEGRRSTRQTIFTILLLRHTDPQALSIAWGCSMEEAEQELELLAEQFSFIFADRQYKQPHALVKEIIRTSILQQSTLSTSLQIALNNIRNYFEQRLTLRITELRTILAQDLQLSQEDVQITRKQLWNDQQWRDSVFNLLNIYAWLDRTGEKALQWFIPMIVEANHFTQTANKEFIDIIKEFTPYFNQTSFYWDSIQLDNNPWIINHIIFQKLNISYLIKVQPFSLNLSQKIILHLEYCKFLIQEKEDSTEEDLLKACQVLKNTISLYTEQTEEFRQDIGYLISNTLIYLLTFIFSLSSDKKQYNPKYTKNHPFKSELILFSEQLVKFLPSQDNAWQLSGFTHALLQQPEEALAFFLQSIELDPNKASYYLNLSSCFNQLKQPQQALDAALKAVELDPDDASNHFTLARCYLSLKQLEQALDTALKAVELGPDNAAHHFILAQCYLSLKQPEQALDAALKAVELDHDDAAHHFVLARCYLSLKQPEQALDASLKAVDLDSADADIYFQLAECYLSLEQLEQALDAALKAVELETSDAAHHFILAQCYLSLKQPEQALDAALKAVELGPDNAAHHFVLAQCYLTLEQLEQAINAALKAVELETDNAAHHFVLAQCYLTLEQLEQALPHYQKAIKLNPNNANYYSWLARCYLSLKQPEQALDASLKAVDLDSADADIYFQLAECYLTLKQPEQALPHYQKAVELDSNEVAHHFWLAECYLTLKQPELAYSVIQIANELEPSNPIIQVQLGNCYQQLKQLDLAVVSWQKAITLDEKEYKHLYGNIGYALYSCHRFSEAIQSFERLRTFEPQDDGILNNLGFLYSLTDLNKARQYYRQALVLNHQNFWSLLGMARLEHVANKNQLYKTYLNRARNNLPKEDNVYERACLESVAGNTDLAIKLLQEAIESQTQSLAWIQADPAFMFIKDDPRFKQLVYPEQAEAS